MDISSANSVKSSFHQHVLESCMSDPEQSGEQSSHTFRSLFCYRNSLQKHLCLMSREKALAAFLVAEWSMDWIMMMQIQYHQVWRYMSRFSFILCTVSAIQFTLMDLDSGHLVLIESIWDGTCWLDLSQLAVDESNNFSTRACCTSDRNMNYAHITYVARVLSTIAYSML